MIHLLESEPPSPGASAASEPRGAEAGREPGPQPERAHRKDHSDRVLAFLRKYPERVESLP